MSERDGHLRDESNWIEGTQTHGVRQMLDRSLRLAQIDFHPAAKMPGLGQVRVELEGAIDEGGADFDIMDNIRKRKASPSERNRIIPAQLRRTTSQPRGFSRLLHAVNHPPTSLASGVTPRGHAVGRGEIRVELNGLIE